MHLIKMHAPDHQDCKVLSVCSPERASAAGSILPLAAKQAITPNGHALASCRSGPTPAWRR